MPARVSPEHGLVGFAEASRQDLDANASAIAKGRGNVGRNHSALWFIPQVTHALKGGIRTVFMLAEDLSRNWGTLNHLVLYSYNGADVDTAPLSKSLTTHFPELRFLIHVHRRGKDSVSSLPPSSFSFCTLWTTAYLLLKYQQTDSKYYLMQDFEPSFYAAGSVYGVIEQTYRFGFSCIANTPGVADRYRRYSDDVVSFLPGVDTRVFNPLKGKLAPGRPARVVFYGRPSNPRNCFGLGVETLAALKQRMDERVRIQSVGEAWDPASYGLEGVVENLGLLGSMEEVGSLYRESDLGLVFMMTPHPSYQPLEYMAAGCVVATNINEANRWLLNERNSLQLEPIPSLAAERIENLLCDPSAWAGKREEGMRSIARLTWDSAFQIVRDRLLGVVRPI